MTGTPVQKVRRVKVGAVATGFLACAVGAVLWASDRIAPPTAVLADSPGQVPTIAVVLSYDNRYPWQQQIVDGIEGAAPGAADFVYHEMKTLGVQSPEALEELGRAAIDWIETVQPDAVIVADDNAMRYVAEAEPRRLEVPIVICGINWPAGTYALPRPGVSGMVEVSPSARVLELLVGYLEPGTELVIIGSDRPTDRAQAEGFRRDAARVGFEADATLVLTFEEWQQAFVDAQARASMVYLLNNAGIENWDDVAAEAFVLERTRVLTVTEYAWMQPFAAIGALKKGEEQGAWAALEAIRVAGHREAMPGPIVVNREIRFSLNEGLLGDRAGQVPAAIRNLARRTP